ncbi:MAG: GNAT family N-acetyltransferase [Acidobacteria bacterium]|nr:GNAT family N-acetyltransferase [Acidobacteriota bacterium]
MTIRKARPEDGRRLLELIEALADFEKLPKPDESAKERLLKDLFAETPRVEVLLAELDGHAVGYAFFFETYSTFLALPTLYLEDLFVLPEYRGRKLGYGLFLGCVAEAHRRGCGRMEWEVLNWNIHAIEFYERLGAKRLGEWCGYRLPRADMAAILKSG